MRCIYASHKSAETKQRLDRLIPEPVTDLMEALMPRIIGASRRPLNEIINSDQVENEKAMRFFEGQAHIVRIAPQPIPQSQ